MSSKNNESPGNPWGSRPNSPPDLDELISQGINRFKGLFSSGGSGGGSSGRAGGSSIGIFTVILLLLIGLSAWSAYYTVPSDSVAVVQRFGKYLKEVPPGVAFQAATWD